MAPTLDDIPNELFELIVEVLELRDILSLRYCSRLVASKATQKHFKSFFRTKHVHLDEQSTTKFVHFTQSEEFSRLVGHLALVGLAYDPKSLERGTRDSTTFDGDVKINTKQDLDLVEARRKTLRSFCDPKKRFQLLGEAFLNLRHSIGSRCLSSLSLQGLVSYRDGSGHETPSLLMYDHGLDSNAICEAAAYTFHHTMESLASNRLAIKKLDLYNTSELQRCSLGCIELNNLEVRYPGLRACFAPLQSLGLSLCNTIPRITDVREWPSPSEDSSSSGRVPSANTPEKDKLLGLS